MKARLIRHSKVVEDSGNIIEVKLWQVSPSSDRPHGFKYSLVYIVDGRRVIGYDNAEGQGDHRHYEGETTSYTFRGLESLVRDFMGDIKHFKEV